MGPLKDLPRAEGEHLKKIIAMKENSWLELGPARTDPKWGAAKSRDWCGRMPFAPDLRGAFPYGEGRQVMAVCGLALLFVALQHRHNSGFLETAGCDPNDSFKGSREMRRNLVPQPFRYLAHRNRVLA